MDTLFQFLKAFAVGGTLCLIGQILVDKTRLTPARILTAYVVTGVILGGIGIYQPFADWAGAGGHRASDRVWESAGKGREKGC